MAVPFGVRRHLPQPPQALGGVATCDRHPEQPFTGFCSSCLRERLAGLDPAAGLLKPSSSSSSAAPSVFKSFFSRPAAGDFAGTSAATAAIAATAAAGTSSSSLPEFRRCRSFSGPGGAPPAAAMEPKRRSCDVRARNTLRSLFYLDDGEIGSTVRANDVEARSIGLVPPLPEEEDEDEQEEDDFQDAEDIITPTNGQLGSRIGDEIRAVLAEEGLRPMKDHINLEAKSKAAPASDLKEFPGSFWLAASVFSKKLQKWRRTQRENGSKKHEGSTASKGSSAAVAAAAARSSSRSNHFFRETQSEVAEDALGRRSCETDPRLSLDNGRISFDAPRYSLDEARVSWDGYLASGSRPAPSRPPPMLSVTEDVPAAALRRSDRQIPAEKCSFIPGGTAQTREYYSDSLSQRRRRSLDRSSSVRRSSVDGADDLPLKPTAGSVVRISPTAVANEYFHHHVNRFERDDDGSEALESRYDEDRLRGKDPPKGFRRWGRSLWGLIHRREHSRRSFAGKEGFDRSNSSVGSRRSMDCHSGGVGLDDARKKGEAGKERREEKLERSRVVRQSPGHADGGLLRFYLTPLAGSRRSKGLGKGWSEGSSHHSFARDLLRLY
ncbi:unnamed protein product [Spirodela intermedia]|uniref:Uncharacterized protein n=1 Tax=Spirodela intermedia TaxID=51605 RepID=A0A7I8K0F5_SPIIN|nr:unnamed protein product [Spirodela intermedia]